MDNVLKVHVSSLSAVGAGTWFFDYPADRIYVGDNPSGKTVETSVTGQAFKGTASNVTISGLIIEKYAAGGQDGAIGTETGFSGSGWIVQNNEIRYNHFAGIRGGLGMQVLQNNIHNNGAFGLGGQFALVEGNEIAYNNTAGYNPYWGAGGSKFTFTNGLIVRRNYVHNNQGNGLWTDINNINTLYENNTCEYNDFAGIAHEISYAAVIRNNITRRNGAIQPPDFVEGSGIVVVNSPDVEVYGNTVEDNWSGGIIGINGNRGTGTYGPYLLKNLWVHNNTVRLVTPGFAFEHFAGIELISGGDPAVFTTFNNRWDFNTYTAPVAITLPFSWTGQNMSWAQWRALGQDLNSSFATF
jgi:hypothetical protein